MKHLQHTSTETHATYICNTCFQRSMARAAWRTDAVEALDALQADGGAPRAERVHAACWRRRIRASGGRRHGQMETTMAIRANRRRREWAERDVQTDALIVSLSLVNRLHHVWWHAARTPFGVRLGLGWRREPTWRAGTVPPSVQRWRDTGSGGRRCSAAVRLP
jgi:hypothetical protein